MYIDDIKLLTRNKKELDSDTSHKNIQQGYTNRIWLRKMCLSHNEKGEKTNNGRNRTTKSRKSQNARRKGNLQVLGDIGSRHHQTNGEEEKTKKKESTERPSANADVKKKLA